MYFEKMTDFEKYDILRAAKEAESNLLPAKSRKVYEAQYEKFIKWCLKKISLTQTMYMICELLTEEPEGGSDMIPLETFGELYTYLARLNCGTPEDGIPDDDEEVEETEDVQSKPVEIHEEKTVEETEEEQKQSETDIEESTREADSDDKKDEAVQITAAELDALQAKKPPPHLTPQKAIHIPGIGPILSKKHIKSVLDHLEYWAERQMGMVMPRNVHHFLCPPLDRVPVAAEKQQ